MRITLEIFNKTPYNPDGLINCLCQPGLLLNRPQKSIREKFNLLIKSCGTRTVPAAKTKPIGLHRLRIAACASAEASATRGRRTRRLGLIPRCLHRFLSPELALGFIPFDLLPINYGLPGFRFLMIPSLFSRHSPRDA